MKNIPYCAHPAAMSTCGSQTLKSMQEDPSSDGDGAREFAFGNMLASIEQAPEFAKRETSDSMTSDEQEETCMTTCVIAGGLPESVSRFDQSLSSISAVINAPAESGRIAGSLSSAPTLQIGFPSIGETAVTALREQASVSLAAPSPTPLQKSKDDHAKMTTVLAYFPGIVLAPAVDAEGVSSIMSARNAPGHSTQDRTHGDETPQGRATLGEAANDVFGAVATRIDILPDGTQEAASQRNSLQASNPTFALPICVTALETHLPAIIAGAAADPGALTEGVAEKPGGSPPARPEAFRVKILTFELQPAALGPLTVRMRMNARNVELVIDVRSEDVRSILTQTRASMVEALAQHGLALETPDIRLTGSLATPETRPALNEPNGHAGAGSFTQDQGHAHHDERPADTAYRSRHEEQRQKARRHPVDAVQRSGLYL